MLGTLDLEDAAKKAAGNWQSFNSFIWFRDPELEDADQWAIIYTHNLDSGLLDKSNAEQTAEAMEPFTEGDDPDVVFESHSHWAVGTISGFSVRVFDLDGNITEAFRAYFELAERMADYPVLNESDYAEKEYDSTLENFEDAAWRLKRQFVLPEGWVGDVYSWLSDNDSAQIENRDDQGGYPSEESLRSAFVALGYKEEE
jgi:hypothetical protein